MRSKLITATMIALLASTAFAETIHVGLNGLVCAFCAKGIEKSFKKEAATDTVSVDLDKKLATITTKSGQSLEDTAITRIITDAGYTVTTIHHEK